MMMPITALMAVMMMVVVAMHTHADANVADMKANTNAGRSRRGAQKGQRYQRSKYSFHGSIPRVELRRFRPSQNASGIDPDSPPKALRQANGLACGRERQGTRKVPVQNPVPMRAWNI